MKSEQQYIDLYQQCRELIFSHSIDEMNAVRDEAFCHFKAQGFPSKKVERYKYTDVEKLFAPDYGMNLSRLNIPVDPYKAFRCDVPNLSTLLYFVVNDMFYDKVLPKAPLPNEVLIAPISQHPDIASRYYAKLAHTADDAATALNTMLAQDGLLIYIPRNTVVDKTIQVINILKATPQNAQRQVPDMMVNRRVLVVAEESAEVNILFCDHTADDSRFLTTQVTEVFACENAKVSLYCMEETHAKNIRVSNVYIDQAANSLVTHNVITLHNGVTRNKLDLTLSGEGAACVCNGCVIADKQQHVDNNTVHQTNCTNMCSTAVPPVPLPDGSM